MKEFCRCGWGLRWPRLFEGSGTIDTQEMKLLLEAIGESPTEEELFRFMADVDEDGTGEIGTFPSPFRRTTTSESCNLFGATETHFFSALGSFDCFLYVRSMFVS